ncbi:hypothetical protein J1614_011243 [Plenodomus biglobosus]|nr:hypothetical protein J1614_011243 [Plenodomus biglobosus]
MYPSYQLPLAAFRILCKDQACNRTTRVYKGAAANTRPELLSIRQQVNHAETCIQLETVINTAHVVYNAYVHKNVQFVTLQLHIKAA